MLTDGSPSTTRSVAPDPAPGRLDRLEHVAVAGAAAFWLLGVVRSSGGLHDPRTAWLALTLMPAVLLTRAWRNVHAGLAAVVVYCAAGAAVVLSVTPTGWSQADSPASQLVGFVALLVTAAYARTRARACAVVAVLLVALMFQFYEAWVPWWGSGDVHHLMVGTFYWHNQLAAWMLGTGLVGLGIAVLGPHELAVPAATVVPFADVAVVLSTSRAALGLLVLGHLTILVLALRAPDRMRAAVRALSLPVAAAALLWFLTAPWFFPASPHGTPAPTAPTTAPAGPPAQGTGVAGGRGIDTLGTSGSERVQWSKAAIEGWLDAPLTGHGFGSFAATSNDRLPAGLTRSSFVHNAVTEALTSGGLAFGLPLLLVLLAVAWAALRQLWSALRAGGTDRRLAAGAAVATLALLGHTEFDFDFHYSGLVVLFGVVGGLLLGTGSAGPPPRPDRAGPALAVLLLGVLGFAATASYVEHHGRTTQVHGTAAAAVQQLRDAQIGPLYDDRLAFSALQRSIETPATGADRLAVPSALGWAVLDWSRRGARIRPDMQALRAELEGLLGDPALARLDMTRIVEQHGAVEPYLYLSYAQVMFGAHSYDDATRQQVRAAAVRASGPAVAWALVGVLQRLDGAHPSAVAGCAYHEVGERFGPAPHSVRRPAVAASCSPA